MPVTPCPRLMAAFLAALACLLALPPGRALALDTATATVGRLNVVAETEGPYVESGNQGYALPSQETAIEASQKDWNALVAFLRANCAKTPGCQLTYETETKAVFKARAPSGKTIDIPYKRKKRETFPGAPREVRAVLQAWSLDTYSLTVRTSAGVFCVSNDYAWKTYQDHLIKVLEAQGEPEARIDRPVVLTVHPTDSKDAYEDCRGYLADVKPAP